ncbi:transposase family protein [Streptomyces sp. NPDC050095]|uniref:transposase family protein n=1 Tax=unclassified Streptomyces TaxID=2593676 RepID=UPI0034358F49
MKTAGHTQWPNFRPLQPDPRDSRGVRHSLAVVLSLTACAVLTGATSLLAVGEWITDAPSHLLERLGVRSNPLELLVAQLPG